MIYWYKGQKRSYLVIKIIHVIYIAGTINFEYCAMLIDILKLIERADATGILYFMVSR